MFEIHLNDLNFFVHCVFFDLVCLVAACHLLGRHEPMDRRADLDQLRREGWLPLLPPSDTLVTVSEGKAVACWNE
jgi:hypothetical protein